MENGYLGSVRDAFSGWKALAAVAVVMFGVGAAVTAGMTDLLAAPEIAREARETAAENQTRIGDVKYSVDRLERTVRIYICGRPDLDRITRIRLRCREFE